MTKFVGAFVAFVIAISAAAAREPVFVNDIGSGCSWVDQHGKLSSAVPATTVAIAVPNSMFDNAPPMCNGGDPITICRVRTACQSHTALPEYNNHALWTECWGMITDGKPDCTRTFQNCPKGQKTCPMTAERCYNSRGVSDQLGVNYDFESRVRPAMCQAATQSSKTSKSLTGENVQWSIAIEVVGAVGGQRSWPQVIYNVQKCSGLNGPDSRAIVCHGDVLINGELAAHPYCAGSPRGCPIAAQCLDLYRAAASKGSATHFTLKPLTGDTVTETCF
jgi:hypothetical protein